MTSEIRCRIAPSPTGEPHVGTAYIGLFNICFAKKHGGKFILRIEDTDQARSTRESELSIFESLSWLGLHWDEGPDKGGPYGPYRQSERTAIYREHVDLLLKTGGAYRCFCTPDDLEALRKRQTQEKRPPGYFGRDSKCRPLSEADIQTKIASGTKFVVRMAVPLQDETISFHDHIRRENITRHLREVDDQVLLKSDGFPTYHLASVVDDHLMKITHVIRGEEWMNSTYKHVLLYRSFGWEPPQFFHLGLLRNPDANKTKISKRKNPVSLRWFRAAGYLPEALLNFLGNMGYSRHHAGMTEEETKNVETFSLQTMISDFDEKRISPTGPSFDFVKLDDMNFHYMARLTEDQFFDALCSRQKYLQTYFKGHNALFSERYLRAEKEITYWTAFLFKNTLEYTREAFDKAGFDNPKTAAEALKKFRKILNDEVENLRTIDEIKDFVKKSVDTLGVTSKQLHMLLRLAMTGSHESLPLYDSMHFLGLYRALVRCDEAAMFLNSLR